MKDVEMELRAQRIFYQPPQAPETPVDDQQQSQ
jgi:hypothetical protein